MSKRETPEEIESKICGIRDEQRRRQRDFAQGAALDESYTNVLFGRALVEDEDRKTRKRLSRLASRARARRREA